MYPVILEHEMRNSLLLRNHNKNQFPKAKAWISYLHLIRQSFNEYCEPDMPLEIQCKQIFQFSGTVCNKS